MSGVPASVSLGDLWARLDRLEELALIGAKNTLDIDEAALYTGYSKGHLYRLTSRRGIPHSKKDRKVYFEKAKLDEWLTRDEVPTREQTEAEAESRAAALRRGRKKAGVCSR